MPKGKFATLQSWSFSVYSQYLKCPFSVCLEKIQRIRIQEKPSPALERGDMIHKQAAAFVMSPTTGKVTIDLDGALREKRNKELLDDLRQARAQTELQWAFTKAMALTTWFGGDAWLRMIIDAIKVEGAGKKSKKPPEVDIIDYKTGKLYDDHKQQRSLYAMGSLQLVQIGQLAGGNPATKVRVSHVYVDNGYAPATEEFELKHLNPLKREWNLRIKQMMSDTAFDPKPGFHCKWCKFSSKNNGGPCNAG